MTHRTADADLVSTFPGRGRLQTGLQVGPLSFWLACSLPAWMILWWQTSERWTVTLSAFASESRLLAAIWLASLTLYAGMIFSRWDRVLRYPRRWHAIALALGWIATGVGWSWGLPSWSACGWLVVTVAALASHGAAVGNGALAYCAIPLLAGLVVPSAWLPVIQQWAATVVGKSMMPGLDFLQIPCLVSAQTVNFPSSSLSLTDVWLNPFSWWCVFVGLLIATWLRRPWSWLPALLASSTMWSLVAGVARATYLAWSSQRLDASLAEPQFAVLTIGLMVVVVTLSFSTDRLLRVLLLEVPENHQRRAQNPIVRGWNQLFHTRAAAGSPSPNQ